MSGQFCHSDTRGHGLQFFFVMNRESLVVGQLLEKDIVHQDFKEVRIGIQGQLIAAAFIPGKTLELLERMSIERERVTRN